MNLERFLTSRTPAWRELDDLIGQAGRRPERLGAERLRRLGGLYRGAAADLALARRSFPGDPATRQLEQRVGRARHLVYDTPTRREAFVSFVRRDYWRAIRARRVPLLIAVVLMLGSAALSGVWADRDPGAASGLAPDAYSAVTQPRPHGSNLELSESERTGLSGEIFTNNIRVTLLAFAGGLAAGIGTIVLLLVNGVLLGVVGGLAVGSGNGRIFFELVTAHGVLELSCIAVSSAAALRMGWALIEPGRRTRPQAVGLEAREAIKIVLGTACWLVVAGLIEGFLTPIGLGLPAVLAIGLGVAGLFWTLILTVGRSTTEPAPSP